MLYIYKQLIYIYALQEGTTMKIVLAYSGGLDTSVIIKWLKDKYNADVIAASVDLGEGKDLEFIREKALKIGASKSYIIDGKDMFVNNYIYPALQANAWRKAGFSCSASSVCLTSGANCGRGASRQAGTRSLKLVRSVTPHIRVLPR